MNLKKADQLKFTNLPMFKDLIDFMLDENRACPNFLPMTQKDCLITPEALVCAQIQPEVPVSEFVRK